MREHFIVPDTQVRPGVPLDHLTAAGNYIVAKRPDVIIHLGDNWDMQSLSSYDRGKKKAEGRRYMADIEAGNAGMAALTQPILDLQRKQASQKIKQYKPRQVFLLGNHEERIDRHIQANPELDGQIGYHNFNLAELGWEMHEYRQPVCIDGVYYAHFFYNPMTGRPYGGKVHTRLQNLGFSFTMGHQQGLDTAVKPLNNNKTIRGLIAGSFYQHDEEYKGPQGNGHWRGCIYKHEVKDGNYDIMELSLSYLLRQWT